MLLHHQIKVVPLSNPRGKKSSADATATSYRPTMGLHCSLGASSINTEEDASAKLKNRLFHREIEISASSYDTAWVAMVPSREYSGGRKPCFPECLDWIMQNQNPDGSWGLMGHRSLVKDSLSCTLACLLALRKWNLGHQLVHNGLEFIGSNVWAINDKTQHSPVGFEIVFPEMINYASQLNMSLPLDPLLVNNMIHFRDSQIKRLAACSSVSWVRKSK